MPRTLKGAWTRPPPTRNLPHVRRYQATRIQAAWRGHASRLRDKRINTVVEKRMVEEIKKQEDSEINWLLSRVQHLSDDTGLQNQNKSPNIQQMIKLDNNVDYWVDLTQLPAGDPSDPEGMDVGEYTIKQIQSRLRFYVNGLMPVHIVAQIIKINNSGRYGVRADGGDPFVNADIVPNTHMLPDTNLRYGGIHKYEKKDFLPPGDRNAVIVDRKTFIMYPTTLSPFTIVTGTYNITDNLTATATVGAQTNSTFSRQVYREKEVWLGKSYKRHAKLIQVLNQETADNYLTDIRNKAKFIGDRFFLQIVANYQQGYNADSAPNGTTSTSNVYFYGVSGCKYTFNKKAVQISVPLPENQTIDNETYDS